MNIEFHTHGRLMKEWVVEYVREYLVQLNDVYGNISRAHVHFREETSDGSNERVCEIELTIFGISLFVHHRCDSYAQAAKQVLLTLGEKIEEILSTQHEPQEVLTTVKI
jgi:hypothetical protein